MFKLREPTARTMSRHCLVFFFFNNTISLKAVSYTGSVFVLMLLDYELQTNIKHISTETANSLLPVPQKLTVCSSLRRPCPLSVGPVRQQQITICNTVALTENVQTLNLQK